MYQSIQIALVFLKKRIEHMALREAVTDEC